MNKESNVSHIGVVRPETAKRNYDTGYEAGKQHANIEAVKGALTTGFWFGIGVSAVIVLVVLIAINWGTK